MISIRLEAVEIRYLIELAKTDIKNNNYIDKHKIQVLISELEQCIEGVL